MLTTWRHACMTSYELHVNMFIIYQKMIYILMVSSIIYKVKLILRFKSPYAYFVIHNIVLDPQQHSILSVLPN